MMKKWLLLKNIPISRLKCKNHTLFMNKMAKISLNRYPIYDQNGWKTIPFGAAHTYITHVREYPLTPPPPQGSVGCINAFWWRLLSTTSKISVWISTPSGTAFFIFHFSRLWCAQILWSFSPWISVPFYFARRIFFSNFLVECRFPFRKFNNSRNFQRLW